MLGFLISVAMLLSFAAVGLPIVGIVQAKNSNEARANLGVFFRYFLYFILFWGAAAAVIIAIG